MLKFSRLVQKTAIKKSTSAFGDSAARKLSSNNSNIKPERNSSGNNRISENLSISYASNTNLSIANPAHSTSMSGGLHGNTLTAGGSNKQGKPFASTPGSQKSQRFFLEKNRPKTSAFHDLHIKSHNNVRFVQRSLIYLQKRQLWN